MAETVYEMMMKIGLQGGILHDLTRLADGLTRIHRTVTEIGSGFTAWHSALGGIAGLLAAGGIVTGAVKLAESAKSWQEALVKAQQTGPELAAMVKSGELQSRTYDISKRVGMNVEDLVSIPTTLFSVTGKDEALHLWEPLAKYSTLDKHKGADQETALKSLVRAGELTGRFVDKEGNFDSGKAQAFLDLMVKIKNATHGMVNEQTILGFASKAGTSARGLTDAGFMMEAIQMQAMGGAQAGTSLMSLWQQMAGGTMFNRTAKGLEDMGLLGKDEWSSKGGRVILTDEASKRLTKLIGKDPTDLTVAILNALEAKGITDPEDRQRMIMRMLNRQTTQRMMSEMVVNRRQQRAERERMAGGMGAEESFKLREDQSIEYNQKRLAAAWHNMMVAFADPGTETFISVLQSLTKGIHNATSYVRGMDPATIVAIEKGVLVVAGVLGVLGTTAVIGAAVALAGISGVLITAAGAIAGIFLAMGGIQVPESAIKDIPKRSGGGPLGFWEQVKEDWKGYNSWFEEHKLGSRLRTWVDENTWIPMLAWIDERKLGSRFISWLDDNTWKPILNYFETHHPERNRFNTWLDESILLPILHWFETHSPERNRFNTWLDESILIPILNWLQTHSIAAAVSGWFDSNVSGPISDALGRFKQFFDVSRLMAPTVSPADALHRGISPINFNPNNNQKQILQPITLTLNLDGHQMGQVLGEIAQDAAIHPTGPPDANSWAYFRAMGNQDTA